MKKTQNIAFLVLILLLLSASIGFLHGRKKGVDSVVIADDVRVVLEQQDAIDYIQPYLLSGNIHAVATALAEFTEPLLLTTLDDILQNKTIALSDEQKVQLLAAMLFYKKDKQDIVMDRLLHYFPKYPVFVAMVPQYTKIIPRIVSWIQQHNKEQLRRWVEESLQAIIKRNNVELLTTLYDGGVPFDMVPASPLLYKVVSENKKPAFVPFLMHRLKVDIGYSPDGKYTPLIKAVEQNNEDMVKILLEEGADPEHIINPEVGNARQMAFERGYAAIELLLMKKAQH